MTRYDWAEVKNGFVKIESVSKKTDGPILNYPQCLFENAFPQIERYLVQNNMQLCTGKSFSEALILTSTNPQYDKSLFIDLPVQYMKTTSSEHVVYTIVLNVKTKTIFVRIMF